MSCSINATPTSCGDANGAATVVTNGAIAPLSYAWSNGANTQTISSLAAGNYTVTITDGVGCVSTCSVDVAGSTTYSVNITTTEASCAANNGTASVQTTAGGTAPYTYAWSNGATSQMVENLATGTYNVTVTDALGCTVIATTTIEQVTCLQLGNLVYKDFDNSGDFNAGDLVLPNVTVNLHNDLNGDNMPDQFLRTTTTNIDGIYIFENLMPGTYIVEIAELNFVGASPLVSCGPSTGESSTDPDNNINNNNDGYDPGIAGLGILSLPITLTVGDEPDNNGNGNLTVDFGFIELGSIGDCVWADIDGDGINDTSEVGISGVQVALHDAGTGIVLQTTTTGIDPLTGHIGYYLFSGIVPGDYYVTFRAPLGLMATMPGIGIENADSDITGANGEGSTDAFTMSLGQVNTDIDAGFFTTATIGNQVWIDEVGGTSNTFDTGDTPLQGVVVNLWDMASNMIVATQTTDINGNYLFLNVPIGSYQVEFIGPSNYTLIAANQGNNDAVDSDPNPISGFTEVFVIEAGDVNLTIDAGYSQTVGLELVDFFGIWNDADKVSELVWITSNEVNNDYFDIERADNENLEFRKIDDQEALGNTSYEATYNYDDETIIKGGTYYYRLRIVDTDGKTTYSDVIAIEVGEIRRDIEIDLRVYPNITPDVFTVDVTSSHELNIEGEIFDMKGALITKLELGKEVKVGNTAINVNVTDLIAGAYIVRLKVGNRVFIERFSVID